MAYDDGTLKSNELLNPRVNNLNQIVSDYARINQELSDALSWGHVVINRIRTLQFSEEEAKISDLNRLFRAYQDFIGGKFQELEELSDKVYQV
ncbi:unnamed protein product [Auanema sp. JU1783]|nr:unnamed protein product [Auanema sp. JU1783]